MPSACLDLGPLRCAGPISTGVVDVHFDGERLRLRRYTSAFDLGERYQLVLLATSILLAVLGTYVDGVLAAVLFGAAAMVFGLFLLFFVVEGVLTVAAVGWAVLRLFTTAGRAVLLDASRDVRERRASSDVVIPEPEISLMDNVYGAARVHLVLYTERGEVRLSGWFWRRRQLERLQQALARA